MTLANRHTERRTDDKNVGIQPMNTLPAREIGHGSLKLAALLLPALIMVGCQGGVSGHAPGLAGVQTQDPGTLNFPLAYVKRPAPASTPKADIDVRDLITSTAGG